MQTHGFLATTGTKAEITPEIPTTQSTTEQTAPAGNDEATTTAAEINDETADLLGELDDLDAMSFSA